jgi:ubiquinone biosynthesis protein UbiJ
MADNIENLLLEMLKGLRNEVQTLRTEMHAEFSDVKARQLTIERGIGGMKRDAAELYDDHARQQASIDRLAERLDRLERRIEFTAP